MINFYAVLFPLFLWGFLSLTAHTALANIVLIGRNTLLSFEDIEANFAPSTAGSGQCGTLYVAEPLDACSPLSNKLGPLVQNSTKPPFVLIIRGGCSFEDKVKQAQNAGFKAAIVYDSQYGDLVAMAGGSSGIKIPAVFVSKDSGQTLTKYAGDADMEVWIIPAIENSAWSIMAISFISLLAMSAVLATCFFVRRHRVRRERPSRSTTTTTRVREFHGMSRRLVKAMPSLIFTTVVEDNCTSVTCAICLEDYRVGDKLRVLPCRHKFHAMCVDAWLTSWRTFCPVCKRDARTSTGVPPPSESTPLLSSSASLSSFSSVRSSFVSSPSAAIQIGLRDLQSSTRSPNLIASDVRDPQSSQRSRSSHLVSPHSLSVGYPSISPLNNSRYMSPYIPSSGNSSTRHPNPLRHSESYTSFSPFASAQSLPGCD